MRETPSNSVFDLTNLLAVYKNMQSGHGHRVGKTLTIPAMDPIDFGSIAHHWETEEQHNARMNKELIMRYLNGNRAERRAEKFKRKANKLNEDDNVHKVDAEDTP